MTEDNSPDQKAYYEAALALRERQIQGKERMRKRLAALSFTEKIKILEKLRDREKAIAAAGLRPKVRKDGDKQTGDKSS
jgi:hypothetical protein